MSKDKDKPDKPVEKTDKEIRLASKNAVRTPEQSRAALRRKVKMFYDIQRLRMQTAGRTLDRATDIELNEIDIINLERRAKELLVVEKSMLKDIKVHLQTMPVFIEILSQKPRFTGIGPTLAGVIVAEVDIHRAHTVSALWRYAGLAPVPCRRCSACNDEVKDIVSKALPVKNELLIPDDSNREEDEEDEDELSDEELSEQDAELEITLEAEHGIIPIRPTDTVLYKHVFKRKNPCALAKEMIPVDKTFESARTERPEKREKLHYNRFFKTKMVGVMADCLIKGKSPFTSFYYDYKSRITAAGKGRDDGHRHRMAMRYMTKMVLLDIWKDWRALEGLEVRPSYQEQYLGHTHHG